MADQIRLTLPEEQAYADVAAETAATIALRVGFAGAEVDRLRREVADAFTDASAPRRGRWWERQRRRRRGRRRQGGSEGGGEGGGEGGRPEGSVLVEFVVDADGIAVHIAGARTPVIRLHRHLA